MTTLAPPPHWVSARLEDIADVQLGKMLDQKRTAGTTLRYLRNINVRWDRIDMSDLLEMPFKSDELDRYSLLPGDVLVCEGGEPGRSAVWLTDDPTIKYQKALHRVRLRGGILPRWLVFHLYFDSQRGALSDRFTGTTIKHLPREAIHEYLVHLPPISEQHRLVAAIESYFTRLDDVVATLERVQRNLKRYRASVLKAAVEGRLVPTEAELAGAEGRDYEPATVLLERILAERRRRWEGSELAKIKASGATSKDDKWKDKYKESSAPNVSDLPALPHGWCWASVDQLGEVSGGLTQNTKRAHLRIQMPFLRVANVYANELRLNEVKTIGIYESEFERVRLVRGDLLIVEGNGSLDQIGRVALWDGAIEPCLHQNHLIKVRFSPVELGKWLLLWLMAPLGRAAIERASSSTSGLHTLSLTRVESLPVPLPPLSEQARITSEVDRLLTLYEAAARDLATSGGRCLRLRQSILKWAFEGRLADQDPTDEPASVLLDRIKAERAANVTKSKPHRRGKSANA